MPARLFGFLTVFTVVVVAAPARSADTAKSEAPTVVLRLDSINNLIEDFKYLAALSGQKDKADEGLALFKTVVDDKGIDKAIDFNRPLGVYGSVNADNPMDSPGVVLIPLADEKKLLDLLESVQLTAEKGEDGVYTVNPPFPPIPIYIRFANKYAYVAAQNKSSVDKSNLLEPAKVFDSGKGLTLSGEVRLDQIPDAIKEMVLSGMRENLVKEGKEKQIPGETEAQTKIRHKMIDEAANQFESLFKEAGTLSFSWQVDRKAGELKGEASFSGKSGSKLAASIADLAKAKSLFAGVVQGDSAFRALCHMSIPEEQRKTLELLVDEGTKEALRHEKDATKREQAEKVLKALGPSFKSGELDAIFNLSGSEYDKPYTFLIGIKLKNGKDVESAVRDLVKLVPERDRAMIKLDAEKASGVSIHRIDIQEKYDEKARRLLGENPIYLAFRQDAVLISGGTEGSSLLKQAIKAEPKSAPQMELLISVAQLAPLIHEARGGGDLEHIRKAVEEAFGKGDNKKDKIRATLEGGKSLKGSFTMSAQIVKFLGQAAVHANGTFNKVGDSIKTEKKKKEADDSKDK